MKKLIPTLLSLLTLAVTMLAPTVQQLIAQFVATHPGWATALASIGFIVAHWLPSPLSQPSDSAVARSGGSGLAVLLVAGLLFVAAPMRAQDATPTPTPAPTATPSPTPVASPTPAPIDEANVGAHFDVSTSYERLTSGANATVISARLPLTPRYAFVYSQYQIPAATAQVFLGEGEFREQLSHLIKSQAAQINLDAIQVYVRGGLGTKRDGQGNDPTFAWGIHGGADVAVGQIGGGTLTVGLKIGILGVPKQTVGPKIFVLGSSAEVAPGVTLRF